MVKKKFAGAVVGQAKGYNVRQTGTVVKEHFQHDGKYGVYAGKKLKKGEFKTASEALEFISKL